MTTDTDQPSSSKTTTPSKVVGEDLSEQPDSLLARIRAKLGLTGTTTLRDTIEDALRAGPGLNTAFSAEEHAMLRRLLRFGKSRVEDIMVPRADIISVDESDSIQDLLTTFEEAGVSRVPTFSGTLDDPLGMIHIKDLFRWLLEDAVRKSGRSAGASNGAGTKNGSKISEKNRRAKNGARGGAASIEQLPDLKNESPPLDLGTVDLARPISITKIRRPVLFVPPSMPAMNLLIRMQSTRNHMALVIDEYGGTDGLVTIEDLVEQVVGDIEDEHDDAEDAHIVHDPKLGLLASARTPLDELENHLGCKLWSVEEEEEIDTLGGLVFAIVGRVPTRGEIIRHPTGIEFEVLDADPRRVKALKVHVPETVEHRDGARDGASLDEKN